MSTYHESNPAPTRSAYYGMVEWFCGEHKDYGQVLDKIENAYQVDKLGMALENACNSFERGEEKDFDSEIECCAAYFEGAWAEAFGSWL